MSNTKIGFISLGCPKNQIDVEVMLHDVLSAGYEITSEDIEADIIIINTCAFIESAKQESIDNILDANWLRQKKLKGIIVTGCMAQRYREQVLEQLPEVDAIVGCAGLHNIVDAIKAVEAKEKYVSLPPIEEMPLGGERVVTSGDFMAYIKIAEGCDNRCAYCAIPDIRGPFRSRTIEDIVAEAKDLDALGIRELVIVAQDTSRYGLDIYGEYALPKLLRAITDATSIPWVRMLYCYPDKITDELVAEMKNNPKIVPYIDLPIQHISDKILRAMNRHGDSAMIKSAISRLREAMPNIVIRSTAIVGFPGETEEDFDELCEFVRDVKFERFGVFTFSPEEDTPAEKMPDQIDEQTKQDRLDILMAMQLRNSEEYNEKQLGKTVTVLCEGFDAVSEMHFGRSYADAPEIDGKVYFSAPSKIAEGSFVRVKIKETLDYDVIGEALI